jgi:hypothetical protein
MSVLYGSNASVSGVVTLSEFLLRKFSDAKPDYFSNAAGGAVRGCGNVDWDGELTAMGYLPPTGLFPGERFNFSGALTTTGTIIAGYARTTELMIDAPVSKPGEYVMYRAKFGGDPSSAGEALTATAGNQSDAAALNYYCASAAGLKVATVAVPNVEHMRLTITADVEPYVDTTTGGLYRRGAGNLDWSFTYRAKFGAWSEVPTVDQISQIQMYVTATLFWDLKWGRFTEPYVVRVEPRARLPITADITCKMSGWYGGNKGYIKTPEAVPVLKWGTA